MQHLVAGEKASKFSVVIPLFNKRLTIKRAVDSVLGQTHDLLELIIVDDGSTDDGADIVEAIDDKRLRVVRQPNRGVAAARNRGVAEASGDYVCFLDADDRWEPWFLEHVAGLIDLNPSAGLYSTRYAVVSPNGARKVRRLSLAPTHRGPVEDFFTAYRKSRSLVNSSSVCVRKAAFDSIGGFPTGEPVGEDVYVWLRLAEAYATVYDARVSAIIHQDAPGRMPDRVARYVPYYLSYFLSRDEPLHPELIKLLSHFALVRSIAACRAGNPDMAWKIGSILSSRDSVSAAICMVMAKVFSAWPRRR